MLFPVNTLKKLINGEDIDGYLMVENKVVREYDTQGMRTTFNRLVFSFNTNKSDDHPQMYEAFYSSKDNVLSFYRNHVIECCMVFEEIRNGNRVYLNANDIKLSISKVGDG